MVVSFKEMWIEYIIIIYVCVCVCAVDKANNYIIMYNIHIVKLLNYIKYVDCTV